MASKVRLTRKMKQMLERQGMIFVGTASKDGIPNVSVRTAYAVAGDDTIIILDFFRHKTFWNWQENNMMAISVADKDTVDGYQFKGKCEIVTDPADIQSYLDKVAENPGSQATLFARFIQGLPPIVIKFTVQKIYSLKPVEKSFKAI